MSVSVCLASYNGERYIAEQIGSILRQLPVDGELIVSDDASTDGTVEVVRAIDDGRITLFAHERNVHYVANFERALAQARGDLVFLADQDDIWADNKLERVLHAFSEHPDAAMVVHGRSLIDEHGEAVAGKTNLWSWGEAGRRRSLPFLLRQIAKGQVYGCTAAFRRSVRDLMLPFPTLTYAHDHWLAVAAPVIGPVILLNEPLVRYRRHAANVSPSNALEKRKQIVARLKLSALAAIAVARSLRRS